MISKRGGANLKTAPSTLSNKCLLAYICDGKNKLVVVKDRKGRLKARAFVRLLTDSNEEPALFVERLYTSMSYNILEDVLVRIAVKEAKRVGLPIYTKELSEKYIVPGDFFTLESKGGIAPFEYSDAGAQLSQSRFTISGAQRLKPIKDISTC